MVFVTIVNAFAPTIPLSCLVDPTGLEPAMYRKFSLPRVAHTSAYGGRYRN